MIELKASEIVAAREATWRRRNIARRIGVRNQSWIGVAEPEERAAKAAVITASSSEAKIINTHIGVKITKMTLPTAWILARSTVRPETGAVTTRSCASSPEIASHERPP